MCVGEVRHVGLGARLVRGHLQRDEAQLDPEDH